MGAEVYMFTTSPSKMEDGKRLGADHFILSKDPEQMKAAAGTLDLILDTVSADHNISDYMSCLHYDGTLVLLGLPVNSISLYPTDIIFGNRALAGSNIGSIQETQEMIDFCAQHGVVVDYELIEPTYINEALERLHNSDVKYRFVIDTQKI
uniref:NADP-dependent alcohol dehydrogenase C n=1 Tax=Lygus hesperus TaxID=30085 RepID=A0A0A9Y9H5_LYGHE